MQVVTVDVNRGNGIVLSCLCTDYNTTLSTTTGSAAASCMMHFMRFDPAGQRALITANSTSLKSQLTVESVLTTDSTDLMMFGKPCKFENVIVFL